MLSANEVDLTVAIAAVFGAMTDPRKRLRAVRAGRALLTRMEKVAVADCRSTGITWRAIGAALGEDPATPFRHYRKAGEESPEGPGEVTAQGQPPDSSASQSVPLGGHVPGE